MNVSDDPRPIQILLVEDSETDALLAMEALNHSICNKLHLVTDGVEAMKFLHQQAPYQNAPRPDLILLDLNMPRKDGREVLAELKADESFKRIPVVVMTTSKDEYDVHCAYNNHANCYIVKPVDFEKFSDVVTTIKNFWFAVVTLPTES